MKVSSSPQSTSQPTCFNIANTTTKKVLLFCRDFDSGRLLMAQIKKGGHPVMATVDDPQMLIHEVGRTTPHLLITHAQNDEASFERALRSVEELFPSVAVCQVSGSLKGDNEEWRGKVDQALASPRN